MKRLIPQKLKRLFVKLIKSQSSTQDVADGLAVGIFIGFLPIMGIQMYVAFGLAELMRKNVIAALIAVWVTNPLTAVPIYLFNLWVGTFFYNKPGSLSQLYGVIKHLELNNVISASKDVLIPLWIGSVVVGLIAAFIGQKLCLRFYDRIRVRFHHLIHYHGTKEGKF